MERDDGAPEERTAEEIIAAATEEQQAPSVDGYGSGASEAPFAEQPEVLVGAAFVGGFMLARLVKRLGR